MYAFAQDVPIGTDIYGRSSTGWEPRQCPVSCCTCVFVALTVGCATSMCGRPGRPATQRSTNGSTRRWTPRGGNRPATEPTREAVELVHATGSLLDREVRS
jgi:hypothetical protein